MADTTLSPFKFKRPLTPRKKILDRITAPTSAGGLDPTFGVNGKLTSDFGSSEFAYSMAVQTDGKIVAVGTAIAVGNNSNFDFAVFRYNADGSLDTSFDADGKVTTNISIDYPYHDSAHAVAIQSDGKIVAAGASNASGDRFALVRYNTDGSLDNSFGTGGKVITVSEYGTINDIAIQTDGKIVVAAVYDFTIARYNSNGSLDASFGTGGIVRTDFATMGQAAYAVDVQTDGKIVAAGNAGLCNEDDCSLDFAVARYNSDGSLDTSFDLDGKLTTTFGAPAESANAVVVQADGKIVAAGGAGMVGGGFAVARYNGDGSLDTTFDGDGKVTIGNDYDFASGVALQPDGRIVASGYSYFMAYDFALVRLNTD
ncbi:MAG: delta-60 repeat domain-containing protein [Pyrinomonadaceae bacterium]